MHMKKMVLVAALAAFPLAAQAAGDPVAGKEKSGPCAACHGVNGIAKIDTYPNLAGQKEQYLINALMAYKNKQRIGGQAVIMQAMATNLSEQDIEDLSAYYAGLEG